MRSALALVVLVGLAQPAAAQRRPAQDGPTQSVGLEIGTIRFGADDPDLITGFRVDAVAPGLVFRRPGLSLALRRATDDGPPGDPVRQIELWDLAMRFWGDLHLFGSSSGQVVPFVPVGVAVTYRRVDGRDGRADVILFDYQSFALTAGLGAALRAAGLRAEARVMPRGGFATRSFGTSTGAVYGLDAGTRLIRPGLVGRFGLSLGYTYLWDRWRVGSADPEGLRPGGRTWYTGHGHRFEVGITW